MGNCEHLPQRCLSGVHHPSSFHFRQKAHSFFTGWTHLQRAYFSTGNIVQSCDARDSGGMYQSVEMALVFSDKEDEGFRNV
jgi:hypothetical protein